MSFQKILIAVDDSQFAAEAATVGIELAESLDAAVGFVNVFDPSVGVQLGLPGRSNSGDVRAGRKAPCDIISKPNGDPVKESRMG